MASSKSTAQAVTLWRLFAENTSFQWNGQARNWAAHIRSPNGAADEEQLVQPLAFPRFAEALLGFTVGLNLAPETSGREGKPDFTPADPVTHPFVFETKSTRSQAALTGFDSQVRRYLVEGRPRIKRVVLTNLIGLRVFELNDQDEVRETLSVDLRSLLSGPVELVATSGEASRFADFLRDYRFRELSDEDKILRIRQSPEWNPQIEVTSRDWVSRRLNQVVEYLSADVRHRIETGVLTDPAVLGEVERQRVLDELRHLLWRIDLDWDRSQSTPLEDFIGADEGSDLGKARAQYAAHAAYYTATKLVLVRIWEDLGLLDPVLYDGGFDRWMTAFDDVVADVVGHSFSKASNRYRALFETTNLYSWYSPSPPTYAEAIYQLGNTYLGAVESDVLGQVYEQLLERIDRKLLGQYYTPRDIIRLIWDLIGFDAVSAEAESQERTPRVLDIATGSGGFLVEFLHRARLRLEQQIEQGAAIKRQQWLSEISQSVIGVELQRFPAYLAELNLLIQLAHVLAAQKDLRLPPLSVLNTDTLSLHNPITFLDESHRDEGTAHDLLLDDAERTLKAQRLRDPRSGDSWIDVVCGNPPYLGEKAGATVLARTRETFPYWDHFVGPHLDYFYWFLILGISKLREGGRFGFITTEYWLRAAGARPLRQYIAERCQIDRLILFRNLRLFPDAPGQHSMVVSGRRLSPPDGQPLPAIDPSRPLVSIYEGAVLSAAERKEALRQMLAGGSGSKVRSFRAAASPNSIGGRSWSEVVLSEAELRRRRRVIAKAKPLDLDMEEGVLSSANRMRASYTGPLSQETLDNIGWPAQKAGIFVLTENEVAALGTLSPNERSVLKQFINTSDVLPYATVLPKDSERIIFLHAPRAEGLSLDEWHNLPFPSGLPRVEKHLGQFRPLLERKVKQYADRRPWWALHRPRLRTMERDREGQWANYCVTANWGAGGSLVVALAPAGAAPAQGLHSILAPDDVPAEYVCGVLNSTVVQDLAKTLPPGYLRKEDLRELQVPLLTDQVGAVGEMTLRLAEVVRKLSIECAPRFPLLLDQLRSDVSLSVVSTDVWNPRPGHKTAWGPLQGIHWVGDIVRKGDRGQPLEEVGISTDLLGTVVLGKARRSGRIAIHLGSIDQPIANALAAMLRGAAATRIPIRRVCELVVPTNAADLAAAYLEDLTFLNELVSEYRSGRAEIDSRVGDAI